MKIVQINAVYGTGSTGVIVKDLHDICTAEGLQCEVFCSLSDTFSPDIHLIGNFVSNKFHALMSRVSGRQGYYSILSTKRLIRHLTALNPDVLHLHNLHGCYINLPRLLKYAAKNDIAVVATLHDCWFYTGGCTHYTHSGCMKWQDNCGHCPQRYEEFAALLSDGSSQQLQDRKSLFGAIRNLTAVGVSEWITGEARHNVFSKARCLTIHNGVDTGFFHPVESNFRSRHKLASKFVILAPANKWFLEINRETFEFFASHLTDNMCMVFIGNGADDRMLTGRMINLGYVKSREEVRSIYSSCDVMVNCSREESLSLLNVEAQACGLPVVTYANTGVKETVDGLCGFAVENGNPEAAWNAMIGIMQHGKQCYSERCQCWVKQEFDKDRNYQRYVGLYKELM